MSIIDPAASPTDTFDWGLIKWFVSPGSTPGATLTFGVVILLPGQGHDRHNHPNAEEVLYVLSGQGEQVVADDSPFTVRPGDCIYVPVGVFHSTVNSGWEPLRLIAIYNPGGAEVDLRGLPDYQQVPIGSLPQLVRKP